jgi:hypothetical protein
LTQRLAGDPLGLVPAAERDQCLGGVAAQVRPEGAGQAEAAGLPDAAEGHRDRLVHAAGGQQHVGAVDHRPQHDDHLGGLRGEALRRLQLGEPGVGPAQVAEGGAQGGAGVGLLGPGADPPGDGDRLLGRPPRLLEAGHQPQVQRQRAEHPRRSWGGSGQARRPTRVEAAAVAHRLGLD